MRIATIILAAGSSSRLGGQPKQLLRHNGISLVRRMADIASSLHVGPVVVVLGANEEQVRDELAGLPVSMPVNANWAEGLASSLRVGLTVLASASIDAFLILLTDQPYVTADLLRQLIAERRDTCRGIVACRYGTGQYAGAAPAEPAHLGVPALFDSRYLPAFLQFTGDVGARKLIRQYPDDCAEVLFPLGAVDLDTPQDVTTWQLSMNRPGREP